MPSLRQHPNDKKDYYGSNFDIYGVEDAWISFKNGTPIDPVIASENQPPEHIKIDTSYDTRKMEGAKIDREEETGHIEHERPQVHKPNIQVEHTEHNNDTSEHNDPHQYGDYNEDGVRNHLDLKDATTDAGYKVFGMGKTAVSGVATATGNSLSSMIKSGSRSIAEGVSEGVGVDKKFEDLKKEVKSELKEARAEIVARAEGKADEGIRLTTETITQVGYVSVGLIFVFLLLKK